jgi:hypothetical protein
VSREVEEKLGSHSKNEHPLNKASKKTIAEETSPPPPTNSPIVKEEKFVPPKLSEVSSVQVVQRILNKNNSSVFLAEVEVKSITDGNIVHKTRTNGIGKWVGTLGPGNYRVTVRKKGSANKDSLEVSQDINIDGFKSLVELPDLQIK